MQGFSDVPFMCHGNETFSLMAAQNPLPVKLEEVPGGARIRPAHAIS